MESTTIHKYVGKFKIYEMPDFDNGYLTMDGESFIEIKEDGRGKFHFGLVTGHFDGRIKEKKGNEEFKFNKSTVYTIIPIIISGSFVLGFYFGNTKFDKDKIELTEKVKLLSAKTDSLVLKLNLKDKIILAKDIKNKETIDSLRITQKDLNSLYLYLGSLQKGKPK